MIVARIALIAGLWVAFSAQALTLTLTLSLRELAQVTSPDDAAQPGPRVVSPAVERKIREARVSGYWVVDEGEYLYRIARLFAVSDDDARALEREFAALNGHAIGAGDAGSLVIGSRLTLPQRLLAPSIAPAAAASKPGPAEPYVDKLIGGAAAEEREAELTRRPRDDSPGLRAWAAELRAEMREVSSVGRSSTEGLVARYSQETERYGDFSMLVQGAHVQPPPNDPMRSRTRGNITLFQDNFALSPDFVANSALGVVRPTLPPWLSVSHRVFLSPPLINGLSTVIASADREIRFSAGGLGQFSSFGAQLFERVPGQSASVTYSQILPGDWLAGATAIAVRSSDVVPDHTTVSLATQRGFRQSTDGVKVQGAITDDGDKAAWIDAQQRSGRLTQRFGAFHIDPDFLFGQTQPARDSRGAYWRGDYRAAGDFYSGGVEVTQDNLRKDPARGGNHTAGAFANLTLRLDRSMQVGGGLAARKERPRTPTGVERDVVSGNLFFSRGWALGTSRLDGNASRSRPLAGANERIQTVNWNQEWNFALPIALNTLLSYSDERLTDRRVKRRIVSLGTHGPAFESVNWDASVTFVDSTGTLGSDRNLNTTLSLDWSPLRSWVLQLGWYRNRIQAGPDNPQAPFYREDVVQLNLRYEDTAGSSYPRVAGAGGRSGSGTVIGTVFFDDNGDGQRQANERGAPGVAVVLDERQSTTTDSDGRYRFALVPSGRHRIRVLLERVALPWGLEDESPREVAVEVRGDARLDIGLTRVAP